MRAWTRLTAAAAAACIVVAPGAGTLRAQAGDAPAAAIGAADEDGAAPVVRIDREVEPAHSNNRAAVARIDGEAGSPTPATLETLKPISIVATRSAMPLADPSAPVADVGQAEVRRSAARFLDDLLRRIPGFSLFRRLGSGAAHPTTQGVSLRGIGPSGTSRALVLVDGAPLNDAFGGWVYWDSIAGETIERVEVLRGSGASLWGNYAMGGVINVVTRSPEDDAGGLVAEGGERGGARTEGWVSRRLGDTSAMVDARWMRSGDYPLVSAATRGPIDQSGGSEHGSGGIAVQHRVSPKTLVRLAARGYDENRDNGTPYTHNHTTRGFFRSGIDIDAGSSGNVSADVFATVQKFSSTFSAVAPDRGSEVPAADQFNVPSTSAGGSLVWTRDAFDLELAGTSLGSHHFVSGVDAMWVSGQSKEFARYIDGAFTRRRVGGASQGMGGIFVQDVIAATERLDVTAALRFDYWESYDGFRSETALDTGGPATRRSLDGRSESLVSPRFGLAYEVTDGLTLRSAVYRGFRAPTINEQVRPFRVRNDITEANEGLDAEKLFGVEGGFDQRYGRVRSSATLFWNEVEDPVFNVTVGEGGGVVEPCGFVPAGGVCRQRRNLGSTRILGVEGDAGIDLGHGFSALLAYLWSDGKIHSAPEEASLVGNRLPQVPRHQGTIGVDYDEGGPWRASVQLRVVGQQFDDDANQRSLDRYVAFDAFVARRLGAGFEVFVAAENLFDETIEAGRTADGVVSIAAPRLVRGGIRYTFGGDDAGASEAASVK